MASVPNITSPEKLEVWLSDKPVDWAQVIALRCALRVFPLVVGIVSVPDTALSAERKQGLILQTWRATFISSVARKYPTDEMMAAAAAATRAANTAATNSVWDAVAADCRALSNAGDPETSPGGLAAMNLSQAEEADWQDWFRDAETRLRDAEIGETLSWQIIGRWFHVTARGTRVADNTFFAADGDREIALQPDEFWTITGDRPADRILDEIAEMTG